VYNCVTAHVRPRVGRKKRGMLSIAGYAINVMLRRRESFGH
jgi:hypothetical protein